MKIRKDTVNTGALINAKKVFVSLLAVSMLFFGTNALINYASISDETIEKDRSALLGSENNPYVILEVVPDEAYAEIGYLIGGEEPIDLNNLMSDVLVTGGSKEEAAKRVLTTVNKTSTIVGDEEILYQILQGSNFLKQDAQAANAEAISDSGIVSGYYENVGPNKGDWTAVRNSYLPHIGYMAKSWENDPNQVYDYVFLEEKDGKERYAKLHPELRSEYFRRTNSGEYISYRADNAAGIDTSLYDYAYKVYLEGMTEVYFPYSKVGTETYRRVYGDSIESFSYVGENQGEWKFHPSYSGRKYKFNTDSFVWEPAGEVSTSTVYKAQNIRNVLNLGLYTCVKGTALYTMGETKVNTFTFKNNEVFKTDVLGLSDSDAEGYEVRVVVKTPDKVDKEDIDNADLIYFNDGGDEGTYRYDTILELYKEANKKPDEWTPEVRHLSIEGDSKYYDSSISEAMTSLLSYITFGSSVPKKSGGVLESNEKRRPVVIFDGALYDFAETEYMETGAHLYSSSNTIKKYTTDDKRSFNEVNVRFSTSDKDYYYRNPITKLYIIANEMYPQVFWKRYVEGSGVSLSKDVIKSTPLYETKIGTATEFGYLNSELLLPVDIYGTYGDTENLKLMGIDNPKLDAEYLVEHNVFTFNSNRDNTIIYNIGNSVISRTNTTKEAFDTLGIDSSSQTQITFAEALNYLIKHQMGNVIPKNEINILELEPSNSFTDLEAWKWRLIGLAPYYLGNPKEFNNLTNQMAMHQFIGVNTDLASTYDLIYIGDEQGYLPLEYANPTKLNKDNIALKLAIGETVRRDASALCKYTSKIGVNLLNKTGKTPGGCADVKIQGSILKVTGLKSGQDTIKDVTLRVFYNNSSGQRTYVDKKFDIPIYVTSSPDEELKIGEGTTKKEDVLIATYKDKGSKLTGETGDILPSGDFILTNTIGFQEAYLCVEDNTLKFKLDLEYEADRNLSSKFVFSYDADAKQILHKGTGKYLSIKNYMPYLATTTLDTVPMHIIYKNNRTTGWLLGRQGNVECYIGANVDTSVSPEPDFDRVEGWSKLSSIAELDEKLYYGLYIGTSSRAGGFDGYFLGNEETSYSGVNGIVKIKPRTATPTANASMYYFETAYGTPNSYYIYCKDSNGDKKYVYTSGTDNNVYLMTDGQKTAFTVSYDTTKGFMISFGSYYLNMWSGEGGLAFSVSATATDKNNYFDIWYYTAEVHEHDNSCHTYEGIAAFGLDVNYAGFAVGKTKITEDWGEWIGMYWNIYNVEDKGVYAKYDVYELTKAFYSSDIASDYEGPSGYVNGYTIDFTNWLNKAVVHDITYSVKEVSGNPNYIYESDKNKIIVKSKNANNTYKLDIFMTYYKTGSPELQRVKVRVTLGELSDAAEDKVPIQYPVYNDASMNNLLYSHIGDSFQEIVNNRNVIANWDGAIAKDGSSDYLNGRLHIINDANFNSGNLGGKTFSFETRFSGNDITKKKMLELENFLDTKMPIIVADGLVNISSTGEIVSINEDVIDNSSYLYEFLDNHKDEIIYQSQSTSNLWDKAFAKIVNLIPNEIPNEYVEKDGIQDSDYLPDRKLKFNVDLESTSYDRSKYTLRLYVDGNADGIFTDKEELKNITISQNGSRVSYNSLIAGNYIVEKELSEEIYGSIYWKLEVRNNTDTNICSVLTGISAIKTTKEERPNIISLQIIPIFSGKNNKSSNLYIDSTRQRYGKLGAKDLKLFNYLDAVQDFNVHALALSQYKILDDYGQVKPIFGYKVTTKIYTDYTDGILSGEVEGKLVTDTAFTIKEYYGLTKTENTDIRLSLKLQYDSGITVITEDEAAATGENYKEHLGDYIISSCYGSLVSPSGVTGEKKTYYVYRFIQGVGFEEIYDYNPDDDESSNVDAPDVVGIDMLVLGFEDWMVFTTSDNLCNSIVAHMAAGKTVLLTHDTVYYQAVDAKNFVKKWGGSETNYSNGVNTDYFRLFIAIKNYMGIDRYRKEDGEPVDEAWKPRSNRAVVLDYAEQGWTNGAMEKKFGTVPYAGHMPHLSVGVSSSSKSGNVEYQSVELVNRGQITNYPYYIPDTFSVAKTHAPYWQLDLESDIGVWATGHMSNAVNANANRNTRDNYYVYSKGNIVYCGVGHNKDYTDYELKFFVNTIISSYRNDLVGATLLVNDIEANSYGSDVYIYIDEDWVDGQESSQDPLSTGRLKFNVIENNLVSNPTISVEFGEPIEQGMRGITVQNFNEKTRTILGEALGDEGDTIEIYSYTDNIDEAELLEGGIKTIDTRNNYYLVIPDNIIRWCYERIGGDQNSYIIYAKISFSYTAGLTPEGEPKIKTADTIQRIIFIRRDIFLLG